MALINGDDYVSGDLESYQQNNRLKDHWRVNNADLTNPQPGMIRSTPTTELLSHRQAAAWEEIIQTNTPISDDKQLIGGTDSDMILIPYEETTNDAIIWGLPVSGKRKLIFCDVGDVGANFTGLIGTGADVAFYIVDADTDTIMGVGFNGDDTPGIWGDKTIHIQHHAGNDAAFFAGATSGENPDVYIYGYITAGTAARYGRLRIDDTNDEFLIEAENNANHEGITVSLLEANQRFRIRQNSDVISIWHDGTDAYVSVDDGFVIFTTSENGADANISLLGDWANGGRSIFEMYDEVPNVELRFFTGTGRGYIESSGGALGINEDANQDVLMFENAASGETKELKIYGFRAADALRSLEIGVGVDAPDTASFDGVSNYYFDGMVGIGIATPGYPLDAEGVDDIYLRVAATGANSDAGLRIANDAQEWLIYNWGATDDVLNFRANTAGVNALLLTIDGNIGAGTSTFGTNAAKVFSMLNGTAPTTSPADQFQMWSADVLGVAGKAGPHWRSEEDGMYAWHGGAGTINSFTYQADIADDGSFTLPAITDSAWGFIQAGDNEEYALFTIDDDGDVTLISNSANVVANADTDGKICLGIASPEEPLTVKNRLGAQKNINLIIWYS